MKKILLLYGGNSKEHNVSCQSAKAIIENIDYTKYQLECVKINKENDWMKENQKIENIIDYLKSFDVIFPIIHGENGEDGKLQGMLDLFGIPYIGSKCGPSYICMDKERTKQILKDYQIPQVPYQIYRKNEKLTVPFPVIVKPANSGSSLGISLVSSKKELKKAIRTAKKYDKKVIIEKFVKGQELECAILENKSLLVSEIGEIISANTFYDYNAKYQNEHSKTIIPANIPKDISLQIKKYAKIIFKILDLNGLARIDFFYDKQNHQIYLNEVNTLPGFTKISMYPKLIIDKGLSYQQLITTLIENVK